VIRFTPTPSSFLCFHPSHLSLLLALSAFANWLYPLIPQKLRANQRHETPLEPSFSIF
jgi:hypothetical protein